MKRFLRGLALFVVMGLIFGLVGTLGMGSAFASSDTYVLSLPSRCRRGTLIGWELLNLTSCCRRKLEDVSR